MEINYIQIGLRIRNIRVEQKMTQENLSEMTGYSLPHISHIETGNTKASIEAIIKIASALNCTANDLLCDNMNNAKPIFLNEVFETLEDCNEYETRVITDIVKATKKSLREQKKILVYLNKDDDFLIT